MILDMQEMFSGTVASDGTKTGQALTATAISTNVLDLRNAATPVSVNEGFSGPECWFVIQVQTAAAGGDAAKTVTFTLESGTDVGLTAGLVVHWTSTAITGATLIAGYNVVTIQLPAQIGYKRYLGVRYTVSAGFTAFNLLAYLTLDVPQQTAYPAGFTIDV